MLFLLQNQDAVQLHPEQYYISLLFLAVVLQVEKRYSLSFLKYPVMAFQIGQRS